MRIALITAAALALLGAAAFTRPVAGQSVPSVALDLNTSGNDDSHVGSIEDCVQISAAGQTLTLDLVIQGIDRSIRIAGYQFDIDYDPAVIKIKSSVDFDSAGSSPPNNVTILSRISSNGGAGFISVSDTSVAGSATFGAADGTANPAPPDNHEDGEGVLARITVEAVAKGKSNLILAGPKGGFDGDPNAIIIGGAGDYAQTPVPITSIRNAAISVGSPCTAPPPPSNPPGTPTPSATVTPGETAGPGTPAAGGSPGSTPGPGTPGVTPGPGTTLPGTPAPSVTPTPGGNDGNGGDEGDGGLSAAAWIGIGLGVAGGVLAAGGAGWYAIRRRRAGPGING